MLYLGGHTLGLYQTWEVPIFFGLYQTPYISPAQIDFISFQYYIYFKEILIKYFACEKFGIYLNYLLCQYFVCDANISRMKFAKCFSFVGQP